MRGWETRASRRGVKETEQKKELSFSKQPPSWIKKAQMLDKRACTMADMIYWITKIWSVKFENPEAPTSCKATRRNYYFGRLLLTMTPRANQSEESGVF